MVSSVAPEAEAEARMGAMECRARAADYGLVRVLEVLAVGCWVYHAT